MKSICFIGVKSTGCTDSISICNGPPPCRSYTTRFDIRVWGAILASLLAGWSGLGQTYTNVPPTNILSAATTITTAGSNGDLQVLTSINLPVTSVRTDRTSSSSFTFTSAASIPSSYFGTLSTNGWSGFSSQPVVNGVRLIAPPEDVE